MKKQLLLDFCRYVSLNVLGMIGLSFYILADTFFIANGIGPRGLTALNLAIPITSIISGVGLMLGIGGATRYKIIRARNSGEEGNQVFSATIRLGLLVGLVFFLMGLLAAESLARLLGADAETLVMTTVYMRTILLSAPGFILNSILTAFIRNDGSPNTAMTGMLTSSLANVLLDYIFIFPFNWGMFGAAFATGLAPLISVAVMSPYFIKGKHNFHLEKKRPREYRLWPRICSLGVSSFVSEVASSVVLIVFNLLLLRLSGNLAVAAYSVVANLALIVVAIFTGIGQGIQPLVSHYYSMQVKENVQKLLRYAIVLSLMLSVIIYGVVLLYGSNIVDLFNRDNDPALQTMATDALHIYFIGFFFAAINILLATYFSAIEEARSGFIVSILRGFVLIVPLAIVLATIWDIKGVWLTFPIAEALCFVVATWLKRKRPSSFGSFTDDRTKLYATM